MQEKIIYLQPPVWNEPANLCHFCGAVLNENSCIDFYEFTYVFCCHECMKKNLHANKVHEPFVQCYVCGEYIYTDEAFSIAGEEYFCHNCV